MAVGMVADALSSGESTVFTGDDDPELVGDSLPFALKLYESLLEQVPKHEGLNLATGSGFIMYANAYIHDKAMYLSDIEYKKKEALQIRAKKLYLRGRDRLLKVLEWKYPGFSESLQTDNFGAFLQKIKKKDVPFLYWSGAGWMGAYSVDPFDLDLSVTIKKAAIIMEQALKLDETYGDGAIHSFYISYYGSMPENLGGDEEKAYYHFNKAIKISDNLTAGPYVSLATSVSINNQNAEEFKKLPKKALEIDVNQKPNSRLVNILNQRKAKWLLENIGDFFLLESED
jgi:predicted anti-sigma-YlaC factor YlaD